MLINIYVEPKFYSSISAFQTASFKCTLKGSWLEIPRSRYGRLIGTYSYVNSSVKHVSNIGYS